MGSDVERMFRLGLSRINTALTDLEGIRSHAYDTPHLTEAELHLVEAKFFFRKAQEEAAEEFRFEIRESMHT